MKSVFASLVLFLFLTDSAIAQNPMKLEGQVVCCAECWAEADRTRVEYGTAENLLKAKSCVERDPTLLAVRDGPGFKLYQLALGKFRLPGKNWLDFVGKRVEVEGQLQAKKDVSSIRVDSLRVLAPNLAEREADKLVGQTVELRLKDLSGVEQSLQSLRGRVVVVNFWATYCVPCRTEMPDLAAVQNEFASFGVQVIGAAIGPVEDRTKVLQFVRETKINFPIWIGASSTDMMRFGLGTALPGTVVIDREGGISRIISGVVNPQDLRKQLESLLATANQASATVERKTGTEPKEEKREVSTVPS